MTMNVVRPARASVAKSVPRSANRKYSAIALSFRAGRRSALTASTATSVSSPGAPVPLGSDRADSPRVLLLLPVESQQLHLDEPARVELELARGERRRVLRHPDRREFEHDSLVVLDEGVDEQLIRPRLE